MHEIEKKRFLKQFTGQMKKKALHNKMNNELHELLLSDTNNGKLYKYRQCTKFPLLNLDSGTMFCQHPLKFNDPFDCRFGITVQSFFEDKLDAEIDTMVLLFEHIVKSNINNKYCENNLIGIEKKMIKRLLIDNRIKRFLRKSASKIDKENALRSISRFSPQMSIYIMEKIFLDDVYKNGLYILSGVLPEIKNRFLIDKNWLDKDDMGSEPKLEDIALENGVDINADELSIYREVVRKIEPTKLHTVEEWERKISNAVDKVNQKSSDLFLMGCLATDYRNRLMWAHYTNNHKGFCIEYDFSDRSTLDSVHVLPIIYSKERPKLPLKQAIVGSRKNWDDAKRKFLMVLLTKDDAWSYENEWRAIIDAKADPNLKMPKITCIYLGTQINKWNKTKIIKIAKKHSIPVKQMVLDRGTYELHAEDVLY